MYLWSCGDASILTGSLRWVSLNLFSISVRRETVTIQQILSQPFRFFIFHPLQLLKNSIVNHPPLDFHTIIFSTNHFAV